MAPIDTSDILLSEFMDSWELILLSNQAFPAILENIDSELEKISLDNSMEERDKEVLKRLENLHKEIYDLEGKVRAIGDAMAQILIFPELQYSERFTDRAIRLAKFDFTRKLAKFTRDLANTNTESMTHQIREIVAFLHNK